MPATPAAALTFRALFADALRAVRRQLDLFAGLLFVLVAVGGVSCVGVSFMAFAAFYENGPTGDESARPIGLVMMAYAVVFTFVASAFARGFAGSASLAPMRDAPLRFRDALREAFARLPAQLGVEVVRFVAEYLPLAIVFALMTAVIGPRATSANASGPDVPAGKSYGWIVYVVFTVGYFIWSSPMRSGLGPLPAVVQAERGSLVSAFRKSRELVADHRFAFLRARLAFGAVAIGVLGATLAPWIVTMITRSPNAASSDASTLKGFLSLGGFLLFYVFGYALFVLDAALDTAFYVRVVEATQPPRRDELANVFA